MLKFIFTLLTDPFTLPVNPIWEYLILTILGILAFQIGWVASPGGALGSIIHWSVRLMAFLALWAITYAVIVTAQWIALHWILSLIIIASIVISILVITTIIRKNNDTP